MISSSLFMSAAYPIREALENGSAQFHSCSGVLKRKCSPCCEISVFRSLSSSFLLVWARGQIELDRWASHYSGGELQFTCGNDSRCRWFDLGSRSVSGWGPRKTLSNLFGDFSFWERKVVPNFAGVFKTGGRSSLSPADLSSLGAGKFFWAKTIWAGHLANACHGAKPAFASLGGIRRRSYR